MGLSQRETDYIATERIRGLWKLTANVKGHQKIGEAINTVYQNTAPEDWPCVASKIEKALRGFVARGSTISTSDLISRISCRT